MAISRAESRAAAGGGGGGDSDGAAARRRRAVGAAFVVMTVLVVGMLHWSSPPTYAADHARLGGPSPSLGPPLAPAPTGALRPPDASSAGGAAAMPASLMAQPSTSPPALPTMEAVPNATSSPTTITGGKTSRRRGTTVAADASDQGPPPPPQPTTTAAPAPPPRYFTHNEGTPCEFAIDNMANETPALNVTFLDACGGPVFRRAAALVADTRDGGGISDPMLRCSELTRYIYASAFGHYVGGGYHFQRRGFLERTVPRMDPPMFLWYLTNYGCFTSYRGPRGGALFGNIRGSFTAVTRATNQAIAVATSNLMWKYHLGEMSETDTTPVKLAAAMKTLAAQYYYSGGGDGAVTKAPAGDAARPQAATPGEPAVGAAANQRAFVAMNVDEAEHTVTPRPRRTGGAVRAALGGHRRVGDDDSVPPAPSTDEATAPATPPPRRRAPIVARKHPGTSDDSAAAAAAAASSGMDGVVTDPSPAAVGGGDHSPRNRRVTAPAVKQHGHDHPLPAATEKSGGGGGGPAHGEAHGDSNTDDDDDAAHRRHLAEERQKRRQALRGEQHQQQQHLSDRRASRRGTTFGGARVVEPPVRGHGLAVPTLYTKELYGQQFQEFVAYLARAYTSGVLDLPNVTIVAYHAEDARDHAMRSWLEPLLAPEITFRWLRMGEAVHIERPWFVAWDSIDVMNPCEAIFATLHLLPRALNRVRGDFKHFAAHTVGHGSQMGEEHEQSNATGTAPADAGAAADGSLSPDALQNALTRGWFVWGNTPLSVRKDAAVSDAEWARRTFPKKIAILKDDAHARHRRAFRLTADGREMLEDLGYAIVADNTPFHHRLALIAHAEVLLTTFGALEAMMSIIAATHGRAKPLRMVVLMHHGYHPERIWAAPYRVRGGVQDGAQVFVGQHLALAPAEAWVKLVVAFGDALHPPQVTRNHTTFAEADCTLDPDAATDFASEALPWDPRVGNHRAVDTTNASWLELPQFGQRCPKFVPGDPTVRTDPSKK